MSKRNETVIFQEIWYQEAKDTNPQEMGNK